MSQEDWWSEWAAARSGGDWHPCTYCGQSADQKDHLESRSWTGHRGQGYRGAWVWACGECNSLLSDLRIPEVEDRRAYVANQLVERYEVDALVELPDPGELEGSLRASALAAVELREVVRERLAVATAGRWHPPVRASVN